MQSFNSLVSEFGGLYITPVTIFFFVVYMCIYFHKKLTQLFHQVTLYQSELKKEYLLLRLYSFFLHMEFVGAFYQSIPIQVIQVTIMILQPRYFYTNTGKRDVYIFKSFFKGMKIGL